MKNEDRYFKTSSLPLSTFLFVKGHQIAGINPTDSPTKKEIVFVSDGRLEELVEAYKFGERDNEDLLVPVHLYEHARNELLDRLNAN